MAKENEQLRCTIDSLNGILSKVPCSKIVINCEICHMYQSLCCAFSFEFEYSFAGVVVDFLPCNQRVVSSNLTWLLCSDHRQVIHPQLSVR